MTPLPRRSLLALAAAGALGTARPVRTAPTVRAAAARAAGGEDEYDTLRRRWLALRLGEGYDPGVEPYAARLKETGELARGFRATMDPGPGWLWPGHPFDPPAGITRSYSRLWTMTQAHVQQGTGLTGDPGLLAAVLRGLDHVGATAYHDSATPYGNWWEWRIGSPRLLMDIVAALYGELTADRRERAFAAVDHFVPDTALGEYSGTSTGANRVDLCRSVALRGILGRAPARIALARDALSPVFPHVTEGDGLYADGSFVQHTRVAYTGTYGQVLLEGLGGLFALLTGSTWAVTDPGRRTVLDSVEHAFAPLVHDGLMMDSVNGRALSRGLLTSDDRRIMRSDHFHGQAVIAAITLLADAASAAERERWHGMVKGWIERDTVTPVLTARQFGTGDLSRLHAVAASEVPARPEPAGHRLFAAMDRAVHRRPDWVACIAMASDRIAYYECGNGENPRGWHTGAGMLTWWAPGHGDQYTDWFWPTVDWYRLPGTTVSTRRLPDRAGGEWGEPRPDVRWVGGTTDGEYAAVGQHLRGLGSTLEARKSWFCADDAVICLGAGITARDGVPVETVVDNRCLGGPTAPARAPVLTTGRHWAHLEGHGGWILADGSRLRTLREDRTGSWAGINSDGSPEPRTRRWQTLWIDHGTDPSEASYAYVLMPGASRRAVAARAAGRPWLRILANTRDRQAVAVDRLGLTCANFWAAGAAGGVGGLAADSPASVLVRRTGRTARVRVAQPTRTGEPLEIVWRHPVREVVEAGANVEVVATGPSLRLRVTPGEACDTHGCEVALG
ncbi:polysaccharide lyase 8 family protein [Streptomyces sp. GC420]|uniref:polysaccharide lyase 8 family protein n=1 Tax=Streptomyces sp. GC420 TaxID=2697568 RepID=UPI001414ECD9|nr:polysaccharide lyase 8 family protein [Streptomyces sp. GC420]NBM20157.1 lyase [Streptomyces sp. GC420]